MRLRTAETLSLTARFYRRYLWSWDVTAGFLAALVAFALRAYASGSLIPLSITDIVNYLQQDNGHGLRRAILMLAASAVIFSATEWLFRPFWASIARGIANIKARLISNAPRGQDPSDLVGRLASDVDFVMWNVGGMYTTFVPNLLTALVATATVWQLSEPMGVVTVAALPLSLLILEPYLAGVERARTVERRYYSELVHRLEERLRGTASDEDFVRSVRMWEKGMLRQVHYDRFFWSLSLLYGYALPAALAVMGVSEVRAGRLSIGALAGALYALFNVFPPLVNALWGLCVLGQSVVPMRRIMEMSEGRQEVKAAAL